VERPGQLDIRRQRRVAIDRVFIVSRIVLKKSAIALHGAVTTDAVTSAESWVVEGLGGAVVTCWSASLTNKASTSLGKMTLRDSPQSGLPSRWSAALLGGIRGSRRPDAENV
jgi:hypothetical protein